MVLLGERHGHRVGLIAVATAAVTVLALIGPAKAAKATRPPGPSKPTPKACPWVGSSASPATRADQVIANMTVADKLSMVHGDTNALGFLGVPGFPAPTYAGEVAAIPRLCIPALRLEDGPAGVGDQMTGVTQLPAPVAAAASWDPSLLQQYGAVLGAEQLGKGVNVDLGPTVNIVRDPRWGRAFESLGEDPFLTSQAAVAEIRGIQSQGVMAQVKHLAGYQQETFRDTFLDNAIIDPRTLHEIYLPAFAASIRDAQVASVMCSYNFLNGEPTCGSPALLNQTLKGELGFGGFVTSDWFATMSSSSAANAGLDMQMPDGCYLGTVLARDHHQGLITDARLDDMVRRILTQMFRFGLFDHPPLGGPKAVVTSPAHVDLAKQVAADGTVLLKNDGNLLPLDPHHITSIALIGKGSGKAARTGGGGSASVTPSALVTPLDGISSRAGVTTKLLYDNGDNATTAAATARSADVAIVIASLAESEGVDLPNIDLPSGQNELISAVARANRRTVVVLNTGSAVTMPWVNSVAGILEAWYPGQADGAALAAVLFGDVNPSAKLPVTFPRTLAQVPASRPQAWPGLASTSYTESLNVGYRWYDANNITPLFPFGYGLSYTRFAFDHLVVTPASSSAGGVTVSVDLTNTGVRTGSEVVQVYVGDPPAAKEPPRQLKGISKVALAPGETKRVSIPLDARSFSHWDTGRGQWVASPGDYRIWVGDSSGDLPLERGVTLTTEVVRGTPPPPLPPTPPGQGLANLGAALSCPEDVAAPLINGAMSVPLFSLPGQ